MIKFICFLALASVCHAASIRNVETSTTTEKKEIIPVLKFETDKKPDGSFRFMYEGGDQSFREESGVVENAGTDDEALEVSGSYRYIDADGQLVEVHYTAGKNGFVPVGTNILSEITAVARAAADLPNEKEEDGEQNIPRQSRSRAVEKEEKIKVAIVEDKPVRRIEARKVEEKKPIERKPILIKVLETKPEEKKPVEKKPVEKKPVERKPVERKPVERKPVEKKPVVEKKSLVESKVAEKKEEVKKPVEEKKVEDKKVEEEKVEEKKVEEKKEEAVKPEEKKEVEAKPEEKKEEETKPEEKKEEETKPEEKKPEEKKPAEKKSNEKKTDTKRA